MLLCQCIKAFIFVTDSSLKNKKHFCPESLCLPSSTWKRPISRVCSITILLNTISYLDILQLYAQAWAQLATKLLYGGLIIKCKGANHLCQPLWKNSRLLFMTAHLCWEGYVIFCSKTAILTFDGQLRGQKWNSESIKCQQSPPTELSRGDFQVHPAEWTENRWNCFIQMLSFLHFPRMSKKNGEQTVSDYSYYLTNFMQVLEKVKTVGLLNWQHASKQKLLDAALDCD